MPKTKEEKVFAEFRVWWEEYVASQTFLRERCGPHLRDSFRSVALNAFCAAKGIKY